MKFDKKYPNAKYLEVFDEGIMKGKKPHVCWHCGEGCNWVDIDFEAHLCSEECQQAKWKEYCKACKNKEE